MKILVTGKNGQLGKSIHKIVNKSQQTHEFIFTGRKELDLSSKNSISNYFVKNNPDVIVNCAAYTAVDKAEKNVNLANQVNHLAVKQLANIANQQQIKLIHISTDYVFDGENNQDYKEINATNPINVYGKSKFSGEQSIQKLMPNNAIIIRSSWIYSEYGNNFVDTMLRLGEERDELSVVSDQVGSPTYATDLAKGILAIINHKNYKAKKQETQIYHHSNQGGCSWYEFAKEIVQLAKIECKVKPVTTDKYLTTTKRPKNTLMNKDKIKKIFGISAPPWEKSLKACITILKDK